jgi:esterase/lipase superfamily enzyme
MTSDNVPKAGASPPEVPVPLQQAKTAVTLPTENDTSNPLRIEPALASNDVAASEPIAEVAAKKSELENILQKRSMMARAMPAAAPMPQPVPQLAAPTVTPAPTIPPPQPTASVLPPTPVPSPAPIATPTAVAPAFSGDFALVKVFYGTDRAALSTAAIKVALYKGYLILALVAAVLTVLFAIAAHRIRRWRFPKAMYVLSFSATIFLFGLTGYAWFYGHLPGQVVSPEKMIAATYGDQRGTLELGSCEVSIPKSHEVGELESPSMVRLEFREDLNKHIVLTKVAAEPPEAFYANLRDSVAKSKESSALVFVHGYNVTFEDAARRTAQIAYDLKFGGVPIFYSWPSQGKLLDYAVDETNAVWTVPHLRQFLAEVSKQSGAKQIHLIAHSMGNRALTGALRDLAMQSSDSSRPRFNQVLLTAPDIDADVFKNDIAPAITKTAERVTLYASSSDAALLLSKKLHGYARAGEAGGDLVIVPGMDTVDVTAVDTSLLGHSYYGDSGSVISDFIEVLKDSKPADQRKWLHPEYLGYQKYWVFQR